MHGAIDIGRTGAGEIVIDSYTEGDVYKLDIREGDGLGIPPMDQPPPAWTMKKDGWPIACGGVVHVGGGIGVVWVQVTDEARGYGLKLCRFARIAMKIVFEDMKFHRVQATVRADRPEYRRWAELMGFECEGLMKKAAPDQSDLYLYARVS